MRIEDYWKDGVLYYIEFKVKIENEFKTIRKHIVLRELISDEELSNLIFKEFGCVESVVFKSLLYDDVLINKQARVETQ